MGRHVSQMTRNLLFRLSVPDAFETRMYAKQCLKLQRRIEYDVYKRVIASSTNCQHEKLMHNITDTRTLFLYLEVVASRA